jgi:hypothetical protein
MGVGARAAADDHTEACRLTDFSDPIEMMMVRDGVGQRPGDPQTAQIRVSGHFPPHPTGRARAQNTVPGMYGQGLSSHAAWAINRKLCKLQSICRTV